MTRKVMAVGVFCFFASNAWVCVAHDNAPTCKIEHEYKGCSADEIAADQFAFCAGQPGDEGSRHAGVTTTTTLPSSAGGAFPTPCQPPSTLVVCQWTSANGKHSKHCTITSNGLTLRCGGIRTRRDGSQVARGCIAKGF